jgi:UDP-glucose:(heptosyl)LPS alpha-1,3-glucosyltransferase
MWAFAKAVERHLAETPYDVVYGLGKTWSHDVVRLGGGCHQTYLDLAGEAERRFLHPPGGGWLKNRTALAIERRGLSPGAYRRVITNSHMVKRDVCARHQVPPELVTVIHNGVDGQRFHPRHRDEEGAALRRSCGFGPEHQVVLFLGSGYARKGLDLVLDAFPALRARCPSARLLVVGYDSSQSRYQTRARDLGLGEVACFLGGRRDVHACYAAADLYVLPTRYDPFANSTLEALASGLPVITSDANGGAEVITPGQDGEVLAIGATAVELSAVLIPWLHPERLTTARAYARAAAEQHDLASKMKAATEVLQTLIESDPRQKSALR